MASCFQAFGLFDLDHDGMISVAEMKRLVERVGGSMSEAQVRAIISKVDTDNNGLIDFTEFRGLWAFVSGDLEVHNNNLNEITCRLNLQEETEIRQDFKRFDLDDNGYITKGRIEYFESHNHVNFYR